MNANNDDDVAAIDDSESPKKGQNKILLIRPVFYCCYALVFSSYSTASLPSLKR
jgi:hypothetical protein